MSRSRVHGRRESMPKRGRIESKRRSTPSPLVLDRRPNTGPMPRIFVSYRREDARGYAGRLYDRLSARWGENQVFIDVDTLKPGVDFADVIGEAVGSCDVLIAVIGRNWLTAVDHQGRRRLDDPEDFLRLEVEAALDRNVRVIPVLVEGAAMPRSDDLPGALAKLARRQALEATDSRWSYDVARLMQAIEDSVRNRPGADARDWHATVSRAGQSVRRMSGALSTLPSLPQRLPRSATVAGAVALAAGIVAVAAWQPWEGDSARLRSVPAFEPRGGGEEEAELRSRIPPAISPSCRPAADQLPRATAALTCRVAGAAGVIYYQFATAADMHATYLSGVDRTDYGNCYVRAPGEGAWAYEGELGRQHCYVDGDGRLRLDWTTDEANVITRIWRDDTMWDPLYAASLAAQPNST